MMFFGGGMLIFWVVVIVAILAAVGGLRGFTAGSQQNAPMHTTPPTGPESPEEILRRRYADSEMSREEYLEAKTTLKA
jgi:uncharacterized membrane protein